MSLLLAGGAAPPVTPSVVGAVYDVEEWFPEDDDEGYWSIFIESAVVATVDLVFSYFDADDETDDDLDQFAQPVPPRDNFVLGWFDADDDADDDSDLWQPWYLDTPSVAVQTDVITGWFDVDDDADTDDVDAVFTQIIESVAAATDFITSVFEVDDDFEDDDDGFEAIGTIEDGPPVPPTPVVPPADHIIWGDPVPAWGRRRALSSRLRNKVPEKVLDAIDSVLQADQPIPQVAAKNINASAYYRKIEAQKRYQYEISLREALKAQQIAWRKAYFEALLEFLAQQDEEIAILLLMMEM